MIDGRWYINGGGDETFGDEACHTFPSFILSLQRCNCKLLMDAGQYLPDSLAAVGQEMQVFHHFWFQIFQLIAVFCFSVATKV